MNKPSFSKQLLEFGKIPPQAVDVEEVVLGACLIDKEAFNFVSHLVPEMFYKESNQIVFRAIKKCFEKRIPVDMITVTNQLKETGELEIIGGPYAITQFTNRVAASDNIEAHADIVKRKFYARELIRISGECITEGYNDTTDIDELLNKAMIGLISLKETDRKAITHIGEISNENREVIRMIRSNEVSGMGHMTGFHSLDKIIHGFKGGDLVIIAGRPGMGKTSFMLSIVNNIASLYGEPQAIFSLEMTKHQLELRLKSMQTRIDYTRLSSGDIDDNEYAKMVERTEYISHLPVYIDDTSHLNILNLRSKAIRYKELFHLEIIFVDYLQLMNGTGNKVNREGELSEISRGLKVLAKELNIPIIALSQLNRDVEKRNPPVPRLSDLRESGAIEQDADIVIFTYRPEIYDIDIMTRYNAISSKDMAEVIIGKHRNGALGNFLFEFKTKFMLFQESNQSEEKIQESEENEIPF